MVAEPIAFVAGATGFTGREVVRQLCEAGVKTYAHVRPDSTSIARWKRTFSEQGAEVDTTAWQDDAMQQRFEVIRPGVVFALLGTTRKRAAGDAKDGRDSSYEAVDYGLSAMLMRASSALDEKPRFVYLSSAGVRRAAEGSYLHARWKVETELLASPLPYTIARPSFIVGERDASRHGEAIGAGLADGALRLASFLGAHKIYARYRSTSNVVLAGALVRLAFDEAAANRVVESEGLRPLRSP